MKTRILFLFLLLIAMALLCPGCARRSIKIDDPSGTSSTAVGAISFSASQQVFCCDPNAPMPQEVGTITVTNNNPADESRPIQVVFDATGKNVQVVPLSFALASGESREVRVLAESCDFDVERVPVSWGYPDVPGGSSTVTVTQSCPEGLLAALRQILVVLQAALLAVLPIRARVGQLITHSSVNVPAKFIAKGWLEISQYSTAIRLFSAALLVSLFVVAWPGDPDGPSDSTALLALDNVAFPPGPGPNGYTLYPPPGAVMAEGDYVVVSLVVEEAIPLADPVNSYQYGFVFDQDGDPQNNYFGKHPFSNDFFNDTDRWYVVTYDPVSGWQFNATDASNGQFLSYITAARVIIKDNAMVLVVPKSELSADNPRYRLTSFRHTGDYGLNPPHDWDGDPTPPVGEPMPTIK